MKSLFILLLSLLFVSESLAQPGRADIFIVRGSVAQNAPPIFTDGWISHQLALGDVTIASDSQPFINGGQGRIFIDNDAEIGWNTTSVLTIHALNFFKPTGNSPNNPNATRWLLNPTGGGNIIIRSDGIQPVNVLIVDDQVGVDLTGGRIISIGGDVGVLGVVGFSFGTNYGVRFSNTTIDIQEGEFYAQGDAPQSNTASYGIHASGSDVDINVADGAITLLGNVLNDSKPVIGLLLHSGVDVVGFGSTNVNLVGQVMGGSGSKGLVVTDQTSITTEFGDVQISAMLWNDADNLIGVQFSNQSYLSGNILNMTSEIGNMGSNHTAILLDNSTYSFQSNVYLYGVAQAQGDFLRGIVIRNNAEVTSLRRIDLVGNTNVGGEQCIGVLIHNTPQALSSVFEDINIHGFSPSMGEHGVGVWIAQNLPQPSFPLSFQGSAPALSGDAVIKTLNGPITIQGNAGSVPDSKYGVLISDGSLIHALKNDVTITGTTETYTPSPPGTASLFVHGSTIVTGDPQDPQVTGDIELKGGDSQMYDKFVLANVRVETLSSGDVRLSSSDDMILSDDTSIRSNSGNVTIVVDARFLTSQNPGPGGFYSSPASTIQASGEIRVYTHKRANNQVLGKIAGQDVIPGIEFLDTNQEQWGVSHPDGTYGGHPFKIYYHQSGIPQVASVSGKKFNDLNGNGVKDPNELFLAGFTFYVDLNSNDQFDQAEPSAVTDANGDFQIVNIPAGTFRVREVPQFGWQQTTPVNGQGNDGLSFVVTLAAGQSKDDLLFGNRNLFAPPTSGSISGTVWNDLNKDGQRDPGEPALQGWSVFLDQNDNGLLDQGETVVMTNGNGEYLFPNLPFQLYVIRINLPQDWDQTSPPLQAGFKHILLLNVQAPIVTGLHFGVAQKPAANNYARVKGFKFHDANQNGTRDVNEPGLQGFTFYVDLNQNGVLDQGEPSAVSDVDGVFEIDQIPPGTFHLREVQDPRWIQTFPTQAFGSDGLSMELTLAAGESNDDQLFGNVEAPPPPQPGSITGYVFYNFSVDEYWQDWDSEQPGVAGLTVNLDHVASSGSITTSTTTTDTNGMYHFGDLEPGEYWVYLSPSIYTPVYPEAWRPTLTSTESTVANRIVLHQGQHVGRDKSTVQLVSKVGAAGWLQGAGERTDTLASSLAVWIDHDRDGTPDERVHFTGSMVVHQTDATTSSGEHRVTVRVDQLDLAGWSNSLGNLRASLSVTPAPSGNVLQSTNADTAMVTLHLNIVLSTQTDIYNASGPSTLTGTTLRMPFVNGRLMANMNANPQTYRNVFGQEAFRVHHLQFIAQYGIDLGVIRADYGDAPQPYSTLLRPIPVAWRLDGNVLRRANDGARHIQTYVGSPRLYLGDGVFTETDGKPSANADADSDDGLVPVVVTRGVPVTLPIAITGSGCLTIWTDYDGSGTFGDQSGVVLRDMAVQSGTYMFEFTPSYLIPDDVLAIRVRLSSKPGTLATGAAVEGEVEDFMLEVAPLATTWTVTGFVYDDRNTDSNFDADEDGIAGVRVFWDVNGNRAFDAGEPSVITDSDGRYELRSDQSGNHEIIPETGTEWSLPNGFVYPKISLSPGVQSSAMFPFRRLTTTLEDDDLVPARFELYPAWPNPFNPSTNIVFSLPESGLVGIYLYDMLGRNVKVVGLEHRQPGRHTVSIDATGLPSGVYILQLKTGSHSATQKVTLVK